MQFIKEENPSLEIEDIRLVVNRRGIKQNYAYVDFETSRIANRCVVSINKKELNGSVISCAISKPPASGANDKRTLYVKNIPNNATEEVIRKAFEKVIIIFTYSMVIFSR
jgi:RNA recognition motif-containing protein